MKKLAIIGSGHLGQQIAHYAKADNHYNVVGYFDDFSNKYQMINSLEVMGTSKDVLDSYKTGVFDFLLIGVGYKHFGRRQEFFELFNGKVPWGRIVHSSSMVLI
jgi:FlaA1/EpsC-like NDP-sugar epimerase